MNTKDLVNQQKTTLKDYYMSLTKSSYLDFRKQVMEQCFISQPTFYKWINGTSEIPMLARPVIEKITGKPIDFTTKMEVA